MPPSEPRGPQSPIPRPLAGLDLFAWMALRRVHAGDVARFEGRYYDSGRRVPRFLPNVFDELVEAGLLTLAEPESGAAGLRRAALTSTGRARFSALDEQEFRRIERAPGTEHEPATPEIPGETREMHQEQSE